MRVHIRRPSRDRSFCDEIDASNVDVTAMISQLEDRERATCSVCIEAFGLVMYMPRKKYVPRA